MFVSDAQEFAGAEVSMILLIEALREEYDFVAILSPDAPEETRRKLSESGARAESVSHLARRPSPLSLIRLIRVIRRFRPAVVNVNMSDQGDGLGPLVAARATRTPTIATLRNVIPGRGPHKERISRLALTLADTVVAPSDFVASYVQTLGVQATAVVKNGSSAPRAAQHPRPALGLSADAFVVGGVGRLHDQKGWDVLCRAAALVHRELPEVEFVVVGDGEERQRLAALPESEHVRFVGYRESAGSLIAAFDLLAVPSRYEAFGRVAAEAMLSGVPVVASAVGGLPEVLGEDGVLVPAERPDLLARAILELARDPERRARLAASARKRAAALFTVARMASETADVIERLVGDAPTVAIISSASEFAGAEVSMVLVVQSFRDTYNFVAILGEDVPDETLRRLRQAGARIVIIRGFQRRPTLRSLRKLIACLRRIDPAIVHVNMSDQGDALAAVMAARICRRPLVATVHNVIPKRSLLRERISGMVVRSADLTIAVSDFIKAYLEGLGAQTVTVKNSSPAPSAAQHPRPALGLSADAFVVGGVGRLHDQKGWDVLCRAAALVHRELPEVEFVVVGDGEERQRLAALPESEHVRFVGYRESAGSLIAAFDLLAVPSRYEGFGLVAIEAMLSGVPVVASAVGGLPEVLGEDGVLVPPERPDLLARAILELARDPERRANIASRAANRAPHLFNVDRSVAEVDAIYRSLRR